MSAAETSQPATLTPSPVAVPRIAKTANIAASDAPSSTHGNHPARRPARSCAPDAMRVGTADSVIVMSVRPREFLAAADDPARDGVDHEGHDEQDEAGRDEHVDVRAVGLREG